jgi:hypothetical protein
LSYGRSRFFTFLFFMLKIFRIRPFENNESCSILHSKSKIIGVAFFLNFLRFSTHFTSFCKSATLLKIQLTPKPLERNKLSRIGRSFAQNSLLRFRALQLGPWPWEAVGSPGFWRLPRPGNDGGVFACSPRGWA